MLGQLAQSESIDRVEASVEADERFAPQAQQQLDLLLQAGAAAVEILTERFVFRGLPADSHAELETTVAQVADVGRRARHERRRIQRQDHDRWAKT
jgi:hypothetical protein